MMDALNIALSGLQAASAQLNTTANNIANVDTPGYQAQRTDLVELSGGGVGVSGISTDTTAGDAGGSNVDLAKESVDLIRERVMYGANAAVIRTSQSMMGALLDMFDTDRGGGRR